MSASKKKQERKASQEQLQKKAAEKAAAAAKKKRNTIIAVCACCAVVIAVILAVVLGSANGAKKNSGANQTPSAAETNSSGVIQSPTHYADIDIQDYGTITVALDGKTAPETVENFVSLAESGFYDNLTFHRIMKGFMMQGGDPEGTGFGGSDKTIRGEFAANGFENPLSHVRGAIAMARSSNSYDSASSQFFIVHEDSTFLDGSYAAFGYVTEGMDVVDAVCNDAKPTDDNGTIPAAEQPVIRSITIRTAE